MENASFYHNDIQESVSAYLDCCKTECKPLKSVYNAKRKKSIIEGFSKNTAKAIKDAVPYLSQQAEKKEKSCSYCGQSCSSGHHDKRNCPKKLADEKEKEMNS
jgi:hypothetical protein